MPSFKGYWAMHIRRIAYDAVSCARPGASPMPRFLSSQVGSRAYISLLFHNRQSATCAPPGGGRPDGWPDRNTLVAGVRCQRSPGNPSRTGALEEVMTRTPLIEMNRLPIPVALALVPMLLALLGVVLDERSHLGYSTWLSACRAAGPNFESLVVFTMELLPTAVMGMLVGVLFIQLAGVWFRHRSWGAPSALAAHAGCASGMAGGLLLCTLALPLPLMLGAEGLLAALTAAWLFRRIRGPAPSASANPRTPALTNAQ